MKHIICFHLYNDYSGSPKVLRIVLEELLKKGYRIDLVTSKGGALDELDKYENITFHYYSYRPVRPVFIGVFNFLWRQIWLFFKALSFKKDDNNSIFYINTILPVGAAYAGKITGRKIIYHYHENAFVKGSFYRLLCSQMIKLADRIICVSKYQQSFLSRQKDVYIIPNALSVDFINSLKPCPEDAFLRKKILMLASLVSYKSPLQFIKLAKLLPDFSFTLVLNDNQQNIDSFLTTNSIELGSNIKILPRQSDVARFYNSSSIVLNLSNKKYFVETFGMTALEAMSAGLPVIVPTVGGIAEFVEDGINGYKIDVQELNKIADTIKNILGNETLYLNLAHGALKTAAKYDIKEMSERIDSVIKSL